MRAALRPSRVLRESAQIYRRHWAGLMGAALLLFTAPALLDGLLERHDATGVEAVAAESAAKTLLHVAADVVYAALVAAAVLAWRQGRRRAGPLELARSMPWATLAALDVVVAVVTGALMLLVVPGIVFATYVALAPPVAKIHHVRAREALRRSVRMVRGSFWRVLAVLVVVLLGPAAVEQALHALLHGYAAHVLVTLVVETLAAPFYGLAIVLMALDLGTDRAPRAVA
jgi:hypothetical protein